jgi:hypothetical protein
VKTANLTPWCSLFLNASKYNICVKKSRYKTLSCAAVAIVITLLIILFFTYAYHLALAIAVVVCILCSLYLANKKPSCIIVSKFELDSHGLCIFNGENHYQLQAGSRFSFLGCWLYLRPTTSSHTIYNTCEKSNTENLFIFRDSLSKQDFSRVSKAIYQVNHH